MNQYPDLAAIVVASRAAQGFGPKVENPVVLRRIATILELRDPAARPQSGQPKPGRADA